MQKIHSPKQSNLDYLWSQQVVLPRWNEIFFMTIKYPVQKFWLGAFLAEKASEPTSSSWREWICWLSVVYKTESSAFVGDDSGSWSIYLEGTDHMTSDRDEMIDFVDIASLGIGGSDSESMQATGKRNLLFSSASEALIRNGYCLYQSWIQVWPQLLSSRGKVWESSSGSQNPWSEMELIRYYHCGERYSVLLMGCLN